ncbi:ferric reductase-like transmembrane domain-containing protein [Umezakia ovalisporum]|uniref:Ferric reductase-like transmembrane domain-containing protein n=1 Tax=Umezakia ovalisporum FSS-43 TaxID=2740520 RepID=A0ABT6JZG0_9CYAN|nr:ferric reductase-like transmembrane domain-containing protein [Umezakia ovalisporum]MDH6055501.1 ferric reductase-like transmembrane domain-containing protein [Umezakia ovalisporum FSS-43]MDH6067130.1 ferric reductase-like transmembrane domain-containing protein [Umezakia ovalisporum APH033B]MDH6070017.1 ferric reductase-like transmembrane domain-containing protein [Umezakia ovalisporum CobakiLakeA]MDH6073303.1 ferric reductase-like transmembrane domain-containing protein [Umezakia ovalispor
MIYTNWLNDSIPVDNLLGCLATFSYILTLLPTSLRVVFPALKKAKLPMQLLKYRRQIGVLSFVLAFSHAWLLIVKRNLDFFDFTTYRVYVHGSATFIIFTLLAVTSNDWCVRKMKKNWRSLHQLTYLAMFLLFWHINEKMYGNWNFLTFWVVIGMATMIILFLRRHWLERQVRKAHQNTQQKSS